MIQRDIFKDLFVLQCQQPFLDGNPINQGKSLRGIPIRAPSKVKPSTRPIIVASILHYGAIVENIRQLGLPNPVIALRPV